MQSYYIVPTIRDRIAQAIMVNVLEPSFESLFESESYGYRPGRGCHDALKAVWHKYAGGNDEYAIEADIKGAFDNISHNFILQEVRHFPGYGLIKKWLKAGYIHEGIKYDGRAGTPQGGIISPLLANIALNGLQDVLKEAEIKIRKPFGYIRYADDFVVTCQSKEALEKVRPIVQEWLPTRGLHLNEEKTKITNIKDGLEFLGFNIKHVKKPKLQIGSNEYNRQKNKKKAKGESVKYFQRNGVAKGIDYYACHVTPSEKKTQGIIDDIRDFLRSAGSMKFEAVLLTINSKLRGWGYYYLPFQTSKAFHRVDNEVWKAIWNFLQRRHKNKGKKWIVRKYFTKYKNYKWTPYATYRTRTGIKKVFLVNLVRDLEKYEHVKVAGENSPDDPRLQKYWDDRNKDFGKKRFNKDQNPKLHKVIKRQKGLCPVCGEPILAGEQWNGEMPKDPDNQWEIHHIKPIKDGGDDTDKNLAIVHKSCHKAAHHQLHYQSKTKSSKKK